MISRIFLRDTAEAEQTRREADRDGDHARERALDLGRLAWILPLTIAEIALGIALTRSSICLPHEIFDRTGLDRFHSHLGGLCRHFQAWASAFRDRAD